MDNTRKGFKLTPTDKDKRIEELEKENAELTQENEEMKKGLGCETCQIHLEYMSLNNRIDDLEKENAKLKKENKVLAQNLEDTEILNKTYEKRFDDLEKENEELKKLKRECETSLCRAEYQYNYEQLTKAKEIIKTFLGFAEAFGYSPSMDKFITETEQFLNSEVEK